MFSVGLIQTFILNILSYSKKNCIQIIFQEYLIVLKALDPI